MMIKRRRTKIRNRLPIVWVLVCLLPWLLISMQGKTQEPIEVVSKKDDLDEIQLKSRLEDRLARDIQAYLGHNRFIVNVDVALQRIRQVIKEKTPAPQEREYAPKSPYPKLLFPTSSAESDGEEDVESLPGLPYVDIPVDREKEAEIEFMREQIKRLQKEQNQPKWSSNGGSDNGEIVSEKTVGVFNKIKKLMVTLVVESKINAEQEAFLRNLVYQKAALNDLRGDELKIIRTEFSALPDTNENGVDEAGESLSPDSPLLADSPSSWMDKHFNALALGLLSLLALLLLILILLALRKKNNPEKASVDPMVAKTTDLEKAPDKAVKDEAPDPKQVLQKTRQEIISLGLGQPQQVQIIMDELVQQEEKVPMVASIYKIMGRSLFRSLFPNVQQESLQAIMAYLADQAPDEEQQHQDLQDFYQLLQQKLQHAEPKASHPFEFLQKLNDGQVLYLIQHEDARIQALVISQLGAEQGARVLNRIPAAKQTQVMAELGQFESFPVDTFKDVADRLAKASLQVPSFENVNADGLNMLISMLDNMSSGEEAKVLKSLKKDKPDTYYKLRQHYFTFSDVMRTPRQILSNALREVERSCIGRAICNTPDDFKIHVLSSLPPKLKALAREDLKRFEGRIAAKDVDRARKDIVHKIREYIATGKFSMEQLEGAKPQPKAQAQAQAQAQTKRQLSRSNKAAS